MAKLRFNPNRRQLGLMNQRTPLIGTPVMKPQGLGWEGVLAHLVLVERTDLSIGS